MERTDSQRFITAARLRWLPEVGLLAANVVFFAMGALAATVGGGLTDWADGSMTIFSIVIGIATGLATCKEGRSIPVAIAVFATGLLIGVGFLMGGHFVDPCARGWWDFSTTVRDTRLCSIRGDIYERFHLLLHTTLGLLAASIATFVYRRRSLPASAT